MTLPPDFTFSQSSLQDYADCARRFELRYLQRLSWPAVETQPIIEQERLMQRGADFHRVVQQHYLGVNADALTATIRQSGDDALLQWWARYRESEWSADVLPAGVRAYPEKTLSVAVAGYRVMAKYDLLLLDETAGQVTIIDWKTGLHRPKTETLAERWQTLIYPYILVMAGIAGQAITPEQVQMVYWFAAHPNQPEIFTYSAEEHAAVGAKLAQCIEEIQTRQVFDLTTQTRRCKFCVYRSLCERGVTAGDLHDLESDEAAEESPDVFDLDFDLDQIAEIEF